MIELISKCVCNLPCLDDNEDYVVALSIQAALASHPLRTGATSTVLPSTASASSPDPTFARTMAAAPPSRQRMGPPALFQQPSTY